MKISVHKYHSVRHDQREPSAVSAHDEDETDAGVRRPARHEARLHHQEHERSAIGAPPRPYINMPRLHSAVLQSLRNPGNAVLLNGLMDRDGTFNGNWKGPGGSSRYWSDAVNLKGREDLGAFAERQLFFSRQLTLRPTRGATRHYFYYFLFRSARE